MSGPSRKKLNPEDRQLWARVARSVTPMAGRRMSEDIDADLDFEKQMAEIAVRPVGAKMDPIRTPAAKPAGPRPASLERPTHRKISKGRVPIEATLDLHDLSQIEAHRFLLLFLQRAHADRLRHVLVITGKGTAPSSQGVLRRAVPMWLATAPFRPLVSGFHSAARHHGGEGALYIRLRRSSA